MINRRLDRSSSWNGALAAMARQSVGRAGSDALFGSIGGIGRLSANRARAARKSGEGRANFLARRIVLASPLALRAGSLSSRLAVIGGRISGLHFMKYSALVFFAARLRAFVRRGCTAGPGATARPGRGPGGSDRLLAAADQSTILSDRYRASPSALLPVESGEYNFGSPVESNLGAIYDAEAGSSKIEVGPTASPPGRAGSTCANHQPNEKRSSRASSSLSRLWLPLRWRSWCT